MREARRNILFVCSTAGFMYPSLFFKFYKRLLSITIKTPEKKMFFEEKLQLSAELPTL